MVRGVNWIGDAVMTIPALRELRRLLPHAHITLMTRGWAEELFLDADYLDELLIIGERSRALPDALRQLRRLRAGRFDLAVLLQNAFQAALVGFLARIPARIGYITEGRGSLLTHAFAVPPWHKEQHEIFYYLNIIAELERALYGTSNILQREPVFALNVSHARRQEAREILHAHGLLMNRPLVALCPGSTNSRAKRWPVGAYAALADKFIAQMNANVLLIGARDEIDVSNEVKNRMRHAPIMLTGATGLAQSVAILSLADVLITNDTGPAHIAASLQRPTLVIFGPTDPTTTRPFSDTAEIIRHPPGCAPCMLRDCPIDHRCMTAITPDEVFARSIALMEKQRLINVAEARV